MAVPVILSWVAVAHRSALMFGLLALSHFAVLLLGRVFRGRENLWMFLMVACSCVPVNIWLLLCMGEWGVLYDPWWLLRIMRIVLYYIMLLSVEEIVLGLLTRILWPKQRKSFR